MFSAFVAFLRVRRINIEIKIKSKKLINNPGYCTVLVYKICCYYAGHGLLFDCVEIKIKIKNKKKNNRGYCTVLVYKICCYYAGHGLIFNCVLVLKILRIVSIKNGIVTNTELTKAEGRLITQIKRFTRTFVTSLRKQPKRLSYADIETTIFRAEMRSVNPSIECSCSLLREKNQVRLLQLCLPSLAGSGEIDGPRQFGASTFHILVEKYRVF